MSQMATEKPPESLELEVHYTLEDDVLQVDVSLLGATVKVELDWNESQDPGKALETLWAIGPATVQTVIDKLNEETA